MRILIHFDPGPSKDAFLGTRLRKNIKGALELQNIVWVDSIYAKADVCHLLSPLDEALAKEAKEEEIPIVTSTFYTEDDPFASFLSRNVLGDYTLTLKGKKLLEMSDCILVPNLEAKEILQKSFPEKRIEVVTPGVNPLRFEILDDVVKKSFLYYERFGENEKYFLSIGAYADKKTLAKLKKLAEAVPECRFFFIGGDYGGKASPLNSLNKRNPKNLRFLPLLADDLYRSALKGASGLLLFDSLFGKEMLVLENFACKTPVFLLNAEEEKETIKGITTLPTMEKSVNILPSFSQKDLEETIMSGYQVAEENDLMRLGSSLKTIYESLLLNKEGSTK